MEPIVRCLLLQRFTSSIPGLRKEGDVVLRNVRSVAEAYQ
jgi:hypothetical protein